MESQEIKLNNFSYLKLVSMNSIYLGDDLGFGQLLKIFKISYEVKDLDREFS